MVTVPIFFMFLLANPEEIINDFRCYIGAAIGFAAGWQIAFPERIGHLLLLTPKSGRIILRRFTHADGAFSGKYDFKSRIPDLFQVSTDLASLLPAS